MADKKLIGDRASTRDEDGHDICLFPKSREECNNQDCFNDETFGPELLEYHEMDITSNNKVDEFERWKAEQKNASKIPLDEAPPRNMPQHEEKMAEAISKLNTIEIGSPKRDYSDPLPNADVIEAIWTGSPKHSSNIKTPDSPYLQDLLSPTHNIWGSPSSEERKAKEEKESLQFNNKVHVDNDDRRGGFSPVLEDEAIVSALPMIQKPIRMEDLERVTIARHVAPPRSFVDGFPKVRPPPGFQNMGPPPPVHPNAYNMYPVPRAQTPMSPAQAQAYYAGIMKQRMAMASLYCRSPPPAQPFPPPPYYHTEPAQLRPRSTPNMPIPRQHARFITPQPRNWNTNNGGSSGRGGRSYDNRRRQQPFSESPKYRPQYYVGSEDEDEDDDPNTLMTSKEKDWLTKIQLMQLTTDKPELDDYYFHTFERRRCEKERSSHPAGYKHAGHEMDKDFEMTLPHVNKVEHNYKPTKFEGSLGQVSIGSVLHPREVVQVGNSGRPKGPVGSCKDTKKKYQLLLTVEKGFDQILQIEDLERMALHMHQDVRAQLYEKRDKLCQKCYDLLGLKYSNDSNKKYNDDILLQMISIRKGRRLLGKMLSLLQEEQSRDIMLAITRNLRSFTKKDHYSESNEDLCDPLLNVINTCSCENLVKHYNHIIDEQNISVLPLLSSKFTIKVLTGMMKRTTELVKNIDESSLPLQTIWPNFLSVTIRDFVTASPKILAKNPQEVKRLVAFLSDNTDQSDTSIIQEQYRLVENARLTSPAR